MVDSSLQIQDKLGKAGPFLTLSSADLGFAERELVWRTHTAAEPMSMTRRVNFIDEKEFAAAALSEDFEDHETFMAQIAAWQQIWNDEGEHISSCTIDKDDDQPLLRSSNSFAE